MLSRQQVSFCEGRSQREVARAQMGIPVAIRCASTSRVSEPKRVESAPRPRPVLERVRRSRIDAELLARNWQGPDDASSSGSTGTFAFDTAQLLRRPATRSAITTDHGEYLREAPTPEVPKSSWPRTGDFHRPGRQTRSSSTVFEVTVDEGAHRRKASTMFLPCGSCIRGGTSHRPYLRSLRLEVSFLDGQQRMRDAFARLRRRTSPVTSTTISPQR